jgi:type IV/VI secretion system ImpK/VasF family protein
MNLSLWEMIVNIINLLTPLRAQDTSALIEAIDLVELRAKLRSRLELLRTAIADKYSERDAYFVIFPLAAHCDELVKNTILNFNHLEWPSMQLELYQIDDAGDLVFELLDSVLSKPETLSLVYEVYYLCLNDGFCGRYSNNPDKITEYKQNLRDHIQLAPIKSFDPVIPVKPGRIYFPTRNYFYYGGVAVILIMVYFLLTTLASDWQPIPVY